ncbi:MAG: hypothetical protein CM15mP102_05320 [Flavobacteriales bacterium]|nr:MAG: hypothetical protein CM15mP102_05320 [Flavobacteriales bacterium]
MKKIVLILILRRQKNLRKLLLKSSTKKVSTTKKLLLRKQDTQDDFLTSFNWHQYQEGIDELDEKQIKEFEKLVEKNFVDTSDDNIIRRRSNTFNRERCYNRYKC